MSNPELTPPASPFGRRLSDPELTPSPGPHHCDPAVDDRPGDALAVSIYRFLESRPHADLLEVFRHLPVPQMTTSAERGALVMTALRACYADIEDAFSRRQYDAWREKQERADEWASSSLIRKAFGGSWHKALDAIGAKPAPDITARALLRNGRKFSPAARRLGLEMFAAAVPAGQWTRDAYRRWAQEELAKPTCPDIPASAQSFDRDGRSFTDALVDAGFPDERELRFVPHTRRGKKADYTDAVVIARLQQASEALGVRVLQYAAFDCWARENSTEEHWVPRARSITIRFGTWARALATAGLISAEEERLARKHEGRGQTRSTLIGFLAAAMRDFGRRVGRAEYRRWRHCLLTHPDRIHARVPSDTFIYIQFGKDWEAALDAGERVKPERGVPRIDTKNLAAVR